MLQRAGGEVQSDGFVFPPGLSPEEFSAGEVVVLRDQPWLLVIVAPPPHLSSPHQMFQLIPIYQHLHSRVISRAQGFPG